MKEISVKQAFEQTQNGILLVDVRETNEVEQVAYDVPNVINVPLTEFQKRFSEIPKNQEIIIACKSGGRSKQATLFLLSNEYQLVSNMQGGILAWIENKLPVK